MIQSAQIQLQPTTVLNVPLQIYGQDFTFIVNKKEYKTSRIISDLLSPKICQYHYTDPTFNSFTIDTVNNGDFSFFLDLINFNIQTLPENEIPFIIEVLEILNNKSAQILMPDLNTEITLYNVFDLIKVHEKNPLFYWQYLEKEIDFISVHFYELNEEQEKLASQFKTNTLEQIFQCPRLQLKDENQLLEFINYLYEQNPENSILYEYVDFLFVDESKITDFINIFNVNDITNKIWKNVSFRFQQKIDNRSLDIIQFENGRYKQKGKSFLYKNNDFDGIINYLRKKSNGNIQNMINITASSVHRSSFSQYNVCLFEERDKYFQTTNELNAWICFDFKENRIIPTSYTIKSSNHNQNGHQPRSWVIEASNDNFLWEVLDEVVNCSYLNGQYLVHTFHMKNRISKEFRFIRMRQTTHNCHGSDNYYIFTLGSIEFYGRLI